LLIKKVKIENFGWFTGKHELEFSINEGKKLNLILGPNGSGKTQLFNLMSWCLYGKTETQFHGYPNIEELFLSDTIANNLSNDQTATTSIEMELIIENKRHIAKREVNFKKIDGKITIDSIISNENSDLILPNHSFFFVDNIGSVIENFNKEIINSKKLDKVIHKMNSINQKSPFKYFSNSEFQNIDNKIQLIGDVDPIESQALGRKVTLDYIFLASIRDVLIPNSVLIVDIPFRYTHREFAIQIYNFLLKYLPQIIFLRTHLDNRDFELKNGSVYELVINHKLNDFTIKSW